MALLSAGKGFYKKRVIWLSCLLAALLVVSVFCVHRYPEQSISVSKTENQQKIKGVWLNYMEFSAFMNGCSQQQYQKNVDELVLNMERVGLNTLFVHLRSHSDSLYPSSLFPWSVHVNEGKGVSYDPLAILIEKARAKNIAVHGWINPYRISSGTFETLPSTHPAVLLKQEYPDAVVETKTGVYYNPAHEKVRQLVLAGVEEVLSKYRVDGIQYDDYFYPTAESEFDKESYENYCKTVEYPLPLSEYRIAHVNLLISATYRKIHEREGVVFGVSPAAGIANNKQKLYADVQAWVQGGYVDYLCPQLYFGFNYPLEEYRFEALLEQWKKLSGEVPLYIGIASYKLGEEDAGSTEWVTATDLLAKQTHVSRFTQGVCFYHYSSLFRPNRQAQKALEELKKVLSDFS